MPEFLLPPLPDWNGLHPLVVHYPIALLGVAPLFVFLAIIVPKYGENFARFAFLLLILGTAGAFLAVATGEAAAEFVTQGPAVEKVLEKHEGHAEQVRAVFLILTVLYGLNVLLLPRRAAQFRTRIYRVVANAVMLILLLAGNLLIAHTGHEGARLVHEFGVHAILPASSDVAAPAPAADGYD